MRQEHDAYMTPPWCVRSIVDEILSRDFRHDHPVLFDPCAGDGRAVREARNHLSKHRTLVKAHANEIRSEEIPGLIDSKQFETVTNLDFLGSDYEPPTGITHVFTNPPFCSALEFVEKSLTVAPTVIMLLRLNFLASKRRSSFFRNRMPDVYVLPRRPAFVGGKTDACEYAWMVWQVIPKGYGTVRVLEVPIKDE